ncbi:MAG: carboxypeptidase-like regulatory domain-containing protein [Flavobacteriaceae bacterium]
MRKLMYTLSVFCSFLYFGCNDDDNSTAPPDTGGENPDIDLVEYFGSAKSVDVLGEVVDSNGVPVEGASITFGDSNATTDENGVFIIKSASAYEHFAFLKATKTGYLQGLRSFVPTNGVNKVSIQLLEASVVQTISSGAAATVTLSNGGSIDFAGSFINEDGSEYTGNVDVIAHYLDAAEEQINTAMPGMLYAATEDNEERYLETYGMMVVELRGNSGQKLNINPQTPSVLKFNLAAGIVGDSPSTIPMWYFDEDKGYWVEDGEGTLSGNQYVAEVTHFSWWNCDAPFPVVNLCLTLVDTNGNPLANTRVRLSSPNTNYPRDGVSDNNGQICGKVPYGYAMDLEVIDKCNATFFTTTIGPFTNNTDFGNLEVATIASNTIEVKGVFNQCNGNPVENGYVKIEYDGFNYYASLNANGRFSTTMIKCSTSSNYFTAQGFDYGNTQTTGEINYSLSTASATTNLGTLSACNTVTEFIEYTLDNNPTEVFIDNISCYSFGSEGFGVSASNTNTSFYLSGNNTVLGTYAYGWQGAGLLMGFDSELGPCTGTNTYEFHLNNWGDIGEYVDISFSGTFYDCDNVEHSVVGTIHVIRENEEPQ